MSEARWFAAYVRSRHENCVANYLAAREVECFLPQYKSRREWKDRRVDLLMPLFPGYLFIRIPLEERFRALNAPGVIYLVGWRGYPEPLQDTEIEQLKTAMIIGNDPRPHDFIQVGDQVIVTRGPLQGSKGVLLREKNSTRVVLSLDLIQRSMSVEVDADAIAPAASA